MKHSLGTFLNLKITVLHFRIGVSLLVIFSYYFGTNNSHGLVRLVCSVYCTQCLFGVDAEMNNKSQTSSVRRGPGSLSLDEGILEILKAQVSYNILMVYNPVRLLSCPELLGLQILINFSFWCMHTQAHNAMCCLDPLTGLHEAPRVLVWVWLYCMIAVSLMLGWKALML